MNAPACQITPMQHHQVAASLDIPIVDGELTADDSHESLIKVLLDLQRYHQVRSFGHQERFGKPDLWSETMVVRLADTIKEVKQMIDKAQKSSSPIALKSSISITLHQ